MARRYFGQLPGFDDLFFHNTFFCGHDSPLPQGEGLGAALTGEAVSKW